MGLLKWCLSLFKCKSQCQFNDEVFDGDLQRVSLGEFDLKYKDMEKIHRILSKRERKRVLKRIDTPRPRMVRIEEHI